MHEDNLLREHVSISLDLATRRMLEFLAQRHDVTVSEEIRIALEEYLARPAAKPAHRLAEKGHRLDRLRKAQRIPAGAGTFEYRPGTTRRSDRSGYRRCSVAVSSDLRDRLRDRSSAERVSYAELIRTAVTFYLSDQIYLESGGESVESSGEPMSERTVLDVGA